MARRLPATRPNTRPVVQYVDPSQTTIQLLTPAQAAAKQRRDQQLHARWKHRQAAIAERDRKARRFWLGFGAIIGLAGLVGLALVGWFIWQALAAVSLGVLAVPALIVLVLLLGIGGHRCVTVVQHWH
jgi:fatty acid desaturase